MRFQNLPFLHFMARLRTARDTRLVTPMEAEKVNSGGSFFAPLSADGHFFPFYRFHFSLYLGKGVFVTSDRQKALLNGLAIATLIERQEHLLLTFELPQIESPAPPEIGARIPRVLHHEDEFFLPCFRRVPRRGTFRYAGTFEHSDFDFAFTELEPTEPKALDVILDRFQISLIGCDPHTKYHRRSRQEAL